MTVGEIIGDAKEVLGQVSQDVVLSRMTDAIEALAKKGNWNLLVGYMDICSTTDGRFVTLPRIVETPLAVNQGGRPGMFRNRWFEFHFNGPGSCDAGVTWAWDDRGEFPVFMDIKQAARITAIADLKSDANKVIRVFGWNAAGDRLRWQEEDGEWKDGVPYGMQLITDFPLGVITVDTKKLFRRRFAPTAITELEAVAGAHGLASGALVVASMDVAPMPLPLVAGRGYYVRSVDGVNASLHATQQGALTGVGAIRITSAQAASRVKLRDARQVLALTQFRATGHPFATGMVAEVGGTSIPSPFEADTEYVVRKVDDNVFTLHTSIEDAEANIDPIDARTPGVGVKVTGLQDVAPVTTLAFAVNHNMLTGDAVTVSNTSGTMPEPLLGGVTYYVRVIGAKEVSLHENAADAAAGVNAIVLRSSGSGTTSLVKAMAATPSIGSASNITAVGHNLTSDTIKPSKTTVSRARASNVATLVATGHGFITGDFVNVAGMSGAPSYNTTKPVQVTRLDDNTFTYACAGGDEGTTPDTTGTISHAPSNGEYVQFVTNGTFPAPIVQGTVYQAEPPMTGDTFTLYATDHTPVDILQPGTGQLSLVLSRAFTIGFDSTWRTATARLTTGRAVMLRSTGTLPSCVPAVSAGVLYYARVTATDTIELYDTYAHAIDLAHTTGKIVVNSVAIGDLSIELEEAVTVEPSTSLMRVESSEFFTDGATVRFETLGTLPAPLATGTDYVASIEDGLLRVKDTIGNNIVLTTVGSADHKVVIESQFKVELATAGDVAANNYEDGTEVVVRTNGVVPSPLVANASYWVRRVSEDHVELYDSAAHAQDTGATTGRVVFTDIGTGQTWIDAEVDAPEFKVVDRVLKPLTAGFVELWAYDYGRDDFLTMLGRYEATETDPRYRRIKISRSCEWIRMRYRRNTFRLTSVEDWIPLPSKLAVIHMMKALELYRKEFTDAGKAQEELAEKFLNEAESAGDGSNAVVLQFNDKSWMNGDEDDVQ